MKTRLLRSPRRWAVWAALAAVVAVVAVGAGGGVVLGCSQTPVNVPLRTFERAQRMDVVCMQVVDYDTPELPGQPVRVLPRPRPQAECSPVSPSTDGSLYPNHLFALVTQTTRGEVAVVDLTAGGVVDLDRSTPGINFLPVGNQPTDVAASPDGVLSFVAAAEPNKFAIYALPSRDILGNSQALGPAGRPIPTLASWPSCSLPQRPGTLTMVPRQPAGDGPAYELVAMLPGDGANTAKVLTIDPTPFLRGAAIDGTPGPTVAPGSLDACPITGAVELSANMPGSYVAGPSWPDGVPYRAQATSEGINADGGVVGDGGTPRPRPLTAPDLDVPAGSGSCALVGSGVRGDGDGGVAEGGAFPLPSTAGAASPHGASMASEGTTVFVADDALPVIHVIDVATPGQPVELAPLLATSVVNPSRKVTVGQIAVSPPTRDFRRYLYATDRKDGSLMVFDVTDVGPSSTVPRVPLTRPHPQNNPFQPPDRMVFSVPVTSVGFARHDFPARTNPPSVAATRGLLCNPNRNAGTGVTGPYRDPGAYYRADVADQVIGLGPFRLRGIFGFAMLSNGQMVSIDVDDWDAPCRRPDPMTLAPNGIAPPQPAPGSADDLDPYHAPETSVPGDQTSPVSLEAFFPVSAPHRPRSANVLRKDPQLGSRVPNLISIPQLFAGQAPLSISGPNSIRNPMMLPAGTNLADPTYVRSPTVADPTLRGVLDAHDKLLSVPVSSVAIGQDTAPPNVRFSWEDAQVHIDQEWGIAFEGELPGFGGLAVTLTTDNGYETLSARNETAFFCRRGVEDYRQGARRAVAQISSFADHRLPVPTRLDHKVGDYLTVTDPILSVDDPYWTENPDETAVGGAGRCWDETLSTPAARHDFCAAVYANDSVERDFPILEAYDDRLVLGRFGYTGPKTTVNREIVGRHESNSSVLRAMRCCFHHQARFKVRGGGSWVAVGSTIGYLHHVTREASTGACVQSCALEDALLNARAPALPRPPDPGALAATIVPDRNSPLALRNPMFSVLMWNGLDPTAGGPGGDVTPSRDTVWRFVTRGQFVPQIINLAAQTTAVAPQSIRFIEPFQQMAVVDGSSQGLILLDLNNVSLAHAPYF